LAAGVPTHAIGHQPQPQLAVAVIRVLVQRPAQAGVGEVSEFDHWARESPRRWSSVQSSRPAAPPARFGCPMRLRILGLSARAGPRIIPAPAAAGPPERWQSG